MIKKKNMSKFLLALFVLSFGLVFTATPNFASAAPTRSECESSGGDWTNTGTINGPLGSEFSSGTCSCPSDKVLAESGCVASGCDDNEDNDFLGFPKWYKYLGQQPVKDEVSGATICNAKLNGIQDIWLVVAAVIELLLRVSAMIAIGFIIFGGVSYVISQGAPDKTKKAQTTIMNAVIGLVISIIATAAVSFVAGRF